MSSHQLVDEEHHEQLEASDRVPLSLVLWLIVLGLTLLFIPFYYVAVSTSTEISRLNAELTPLAATSTALNRFPAGDTNQASAAETQIASLTAVSPTLSAANINWPVAMNAIRSTDPSQLAIMRVEQQGRQLILTGRAVDDAVVVAYGQQLEASGAFSSVLVQSIVQVSEPFLSPTPTATDVAATPASTNVPTHATATSTPTPRATAVLATATRRPTWTPSPDLRDAFEWDDQHAKPIYLGQVQTHSFYPTFDVDNVSFLAKAGRTYRITTKNLAPGVDTFLTVSYAETMLTNDDAELGTLASEVTLTAPVEQDVQVWVRITNRGAYGDEMTYQILAEEIVPTVTPTAVPVTPSSTPLPTAEATATPIPSATPDLRDAFEPDDPTPAQIFLNQTPQPHNFFPADDVDYLQFQVKGNRAYEIITSDLAPGVDTEMTVTLGSETWTNDDYDVPGSNNLASAICLSTTADQEDLSAQVTIQNNTPQYGPDLTYTVALSEVHTLDLDVAAIDFGTVMTNVVELPTQSLALSAAVPLTWTAVSDVPWVVLNQSEGSTPATITASADVSGLPVGEHSGILTFDWIATTTCQKTVPITVTIRAASESILPNSSLVVSKTGPHLGKRLLFQNGTAVEFVIVLEVGNE